MSIFGSIPEALSEAFLRAYMMRFQQNYAQRQAQQGRETDYQDWVRRQLFLQQQEAPERARVESERARVEAERAAAQKKQEAIARINTYWSKFPKEQIANNPQFLADWQAANLPTQAAPQTTDIPSPRPEEGSLGRLLAPGGMQQIPTGQTITQPLLPPAPPPEPGRPIINPRTGQVVGELPPGAPAPTVLPFPPAPPRPTAPPTRRQLYSASGQPLGQPLAPGIIPQVLPTPRAPRAPITRAVGAPPVATDQGGRYQIVPGTRGGQSVLDRQTGVRLTIPQATARAKAEGDADLAKKLGIKLPAQAAKQTAVDRRRTDLEKKLLDLDTQLMALTDELQRTPPTNLKRRQEIAASQARLISNIRVLDRQLKQLPKARAVGPAPKAMDSLSDLYK